ncbi:MAG: GNAT family N-acetyltransferase [Bacteroidia bacterium]|nr:GNAT family N-acetyltransferase [Bacteroidia bacterium]
MKIIEPQTQQEFEAYYLVRYQTLRKPWNQPIGSEKDEFESSSIHAMALNDKDKIIGVCRLQKNTDFEFQIRFMGVIDEAQGLGVGKKLIDYMEKKATSLGAQKMILQARENAVPFYLKCGYSIKQKSFVLWNIIQHYLMEKELD